MEHNAVQLVCDKCGHFNWDGLATKLMRAVALHHINTIWVPSAVYDHMKQIARHADDLWGLPQPTDDWHLRYRGIDVKVCDNYEPAPWPNKAGEMYLIVNRDGSFIYEWKE